MLRQGSARPQMRSKAFRGLFYEDVSEVQAHLALMSADWTTMQECTLMIVLSHW